MLQLLPNLVPYGPLIALGLSALVAFLMPIFFVYVRHDVRLQRLRIVAKCIKIFDLRGFKKVGEPVRTLPSPSFEYVIEKYVEDLPLRAARNSGLATDLRFGASPGGEEPDVDAPWWALKSSHALIIAALPFMALCTVGFYTAFSCLGVGGAESLLGKPWQPLLLLGALDAHHTPAQYFEPVMTVAVVAFIGAFVFSLGSLARAVATFDLSPVTMLRLATNIIAGVAGAIIAYRAFPDLTAVSDIWTPGATGSPAPPQPAAGLPGLWILAAFMAGLVPDLIINWLIGLAQDRFGGKSMDNKLLRSAKSVSPEIIDGVDFFTRFRLQQANIYEVQNLAVANPIMLFVETPYGLYQCIDWVAQAQLCTIVGSERFLMLRGYNLRTIFDIERAILSRHTTSQLRRFVVSMMMSTPPEPEAPRWLFWPTKSGAPPTGFAAVGSADFGRATAEIFSEPAIGADGELIDGDPDRTLKHLGRIIIDDLHVHRLRDVWSLVEERLNEGGVLRDALPDTEAPPL